MKRKMISFILLLSVLMPNCVFAADVSISATGSYTVGETVTQGAIPYLDGETLYVPVVPVLESLGIAATQEGNSVTTNNTAIVVGSNMIRKDSKDYLTSLAPVLRDGVVYADSATMQILYDVTISQPTADGTVHASFVDNTSVKVVISENGDYSINDVPTGKKAPVPYVEKDILFLPVVPVLEAVGIPVEQVGRDVMTVDTKITAGTNLVTYRSQGYLANIAPREKDGVIYADSLLMEGVFGVRANRDKDGVVTIQYGSDGGGAGQASNETLQTDDSWYSMIQKEGTAEEQGLTDVELIKKNYAKTSFDATGSPERLLSLMRPDGAFTDINYKEDLAITFAPVEHINRIAILCSMIYCPENAYYRDPEGMEAIVRATNYYLKHRFSSTNWWWNDIGIPQAWQQVVMFNPEGLEQNWDEVMEYCKGVVGAGNGASSQPFVLNDPLAKNEHATRTYTGSGPGPGERIQVSMREMFYDGRTPEEHDQIMRDCMAGISMEMAFISTRTDYNTTNKRGETMSVQADGSYHDHGRSLMSLSYGAQYLSTVYMTLHNFRGTSYRLTDEAVINMQNVLLDGYRWFYYNGDTNAHWVQNGMGRGVGQSASYATQDFSMNVNRVYYVTYIADTLLKEYGSVVTRPSELQELVNHVANAKQDNFVGNRYFWVSDYLSHHRKDWSFSVLVPSARMDEQEVMGGQTDQGLFYTAAPHNLLTVGDDNAYPATRDWNRLPGTTVEMNYYTLVNGEVTEIPDSPVAGGTSDGMYGMGMCDFLGGFANGVALKRSWFCFDDEVVCLGADINGKTNDIVSTTVDQIRTKGAVLVGTGENSKDITVTGDALRTDISGSTWVLNGDTGYVIPADSTTYVEQGMRYGDMHDHYSVAPEGTLSEGDVFIVGIDHGLSPEGASYQYIILPRTTEEELAAYAAEPKAQVIANTGDLQAVWHSDLQILQAAFYKAGSVTTPTGLTLSVSEPTAVMVRFYDDGSYSVHAADVQQRTVRTKVTLAGPVATTLIFEFGEGEKGWIAGKTMHYYSSDGKFRDIEAYNPNLGENTEFVEPANLEAVLVNGELLKGFDSYIHFYEIGTFDSVPEIKAKGNLTTFVSMNETEAKVRVVDPSNPDNEAIYVFRFAVKEPVAEE